MYRRTIRALAVFATVAIIGVSVPQSANATTFLPLTTEQLADTATAVIEGEVIEVSTEVSSSGAVWTTARVRVSNTLKGAVDDEIVIHSMGGTYGAYSTHIEGQAVFSEGEHILTFLHRDNIGRYMPIGKFLGKYTVRRAAGDSREHVMRWHPRSEWAFDARFLPHPPIERRVYADDFRQSIMEHLAQPWSGELIPGISEELQRRVNTAEQRSAQ